MKGYTTIQEIENYLLITIDATFTTQVERWIADIEKYIDMKTGRNFVADTTETARLYDGDGTSVLLVDDCITITEVKDDASVFATTDYFLYPANTLPKRKVKLDGGIFSRGNQNISVKGKWGYSSVVPEDVKLVATLLVAGIINYSDNSEGEVKSMTVGRYSVTYKDEQQWQDFKRMEEILENYQTLL